MAKSKKKARADKTEAGRIEQKAVLPEAAVSLSETAPASNGHDAPTDAPPDTAPDPPKTAPPALPLPALVRPAPDSPVLSDDSATLAQITQERDQYKTSYENLLSKLSGMKLVFSKMKESQSELEVVREQLGASDAERQQLAESVRTLTDENLELNNECERMSASLTTLRREYQASEEALADDKYNLENANAALNKKIAELKLQLQDADLAQSEATMATRAQQLQIEDLESQLAAAAAQAASVARTLALATQAHERQVGDLEAKLAAQALQITTLHAEQAALRDEVAVERARNQQHEADAEAYRAAKAQIALLEAEVNNKQLLIGKLRHEAVILNEHLTKSLTMLKQHLQSSPNNTIDKELISNVVVSFLQFPRGDPKKFEALQLVSALLGWDETQKIAAGLSHGGGAQQGDKHPLRESFVSLWTEYLEKESTR